MSKFTKVHVSSLLGLLNDGYHLNLPTPGLFLARYRYTVQLLVGDSFDPATEIPYFSAIPSFSSITVTGGSLQGKDVQLAGFTREFAKVRVKNDKTGKLRRIKKKFLGFHMTRHRRSPRIAARSSSTSSNEKSFKTVRTIHVFKYIPRALPCNSVARIKSIVANIRQEKKELNAKRKALMSSRFPSFRQNQASSSATTFTSASASTAQAKDLLSVSPCEDARFDSVDFSNEVTGAEEHKPGEIRKVAITNTATLAREKNLN